MGTGDPGAPGNEKLGPAFDTASLLSLYRTAPYVHDGTAPTLAYLLTKANPGDRVRPAPQSVALQRRRRPRAVPCRRPEGICVALRRRNSNSHYPGLEAWRSSCRGRVA